MNRILALDLETTGLVSAYDYIVQIGAAVMESGEVVGLPFQTRVQPNLAKFKITLDALAAHVGDIRSEQGQERAARWFAQAFDWPEPKLAAKDFCEWLESVDSAHLPIVAHNASFDSGFLAQFVFQQRAAFGKIQRLSPVWIDTMALAKMALPGAGSYSLDSVLLALGLPARPLAHDALQDAILAGRAYHLLSRELNFNPLSNASKRGHDLDTRLIS